METLRRKWPANLVAAAAAQAELRALAAAKFGHADRMLFTREGLEQATPQLVADHRAERLVAAVGREQVLDLCCGIGGDAAALARAGLRPVLVDRDPLHLRLTRHNVAVSAGTEPSAAVADVTTLRLRPTNVVHIDPARRSAAAAGGRRGGYQPPLDWCQQLPATRTVVKAAPGIPHALIAPGWEAEWVAVGSDLKAAVLWSPALAGLPDARRATVLDGSDTHELVADASLPAPPVGAPAEWVVDPNPAVTRAGAVADLADRLDGWLIDPRIGFIACNQQPATPFGRTLRVVASLPGRSGGCPAYSPKPALATCRSDAAGRPVMSRRCAADCFPDRPGIGGSRCCSLGTRTGRGRLSAQPRDH